MATPPLLVCVLTLHLSAGISNTSASKATPTANNTLTLTTSTDQRSGQMTADSILTGDPLMTRATRVAIETAVHVGILPVVVTCGVTMNVINMAVFLHQGLSDRINVCLFSLAVCDTGYLLFVMANRFGNILHYIDARAAEYWGMQALSLIGIYVAFLNTSNCLTLLISLERCFCVVWPLKVKTIISDRTLKCLVVLAYVVSFLSNIMFNFKFAVTTFWDPSANRTRYRVVFTQLYRHNRDVIDFVLENVNMIIPTTSVTVVMVTTSVIAVRMRSVLQWRLGRTQMTSSKEQREAMVTRMLVVICVIYTVCTLPYVAHAFFRLTVKEFRPGGQMENTANSTIGLVHAVLSINSSTNFVVYYTMSTRFKETLHHMMKRKPRKDDSEDSSHTAITTD